MLRDGQTGDWIGTFIGHQGATWQAKLSPDMSKAATASADFSAKVWDTHSGEQLYDLKHKHVVRAVAYPWGDSSMLATGGHEKILRIFDLETDTSGNNIRPTQNGDSPSGTKTTEIDTKQAHEVGGIHPDTIKFIVWPQDGNMIITAAGKTLRWHDLPARKAIHELVLDSEIKSCELVSLAPEYTDPSDIGGGLPVMCVAAGKTVYFFGGERCEDELKRHQLSRGIAGLALDLKNRKFIVGEDPGTWARIYSFDDAEELEVMKGHHGPIWSIQYSPDNKLYATGSEDGTIRMWKNTEEEYGLWKVPTNGAGAERTD